MISDVRTVELGQVIAGKLPELLDSPGLLLTVGRNASKPAELVTLLEAGSDGEASPGAEKLVIAANVVGGSLGRIGTARLGPSKLAAARGLAFLARWLQ